MKIVRSILILLGLLLFTAYFVWTIVLILPKSDEAICQRVETRVLDTDELGFIGEKDIAAEVNDMHQKHVGTTFNKINYQNVEKEVAKNHFVREVACYNTASGALRIDARQRRPKFRVLTAFGSYYIDDTRHYMPTSTRFSMYVPVVSGIVDEQFLKGELYDFIDKIEDDDFWGNQITQIRVLPGNELMLVPRVGDHVIRLGRLENVDQKLDKMLTFYRKGLPYIGWNRYSVIDLRYKNQVVCTKRQQ